MHALRIGLFAACALSLVGCGGGGESTYPVKGKVTFGGTPALENTRVNFVPVDPAGEAATGVVAADGTYAVYSGTDGREGARAGKYKVHFTYASSSTDYMMNRSGKKDAAPKQDDGGIPKIFQSGSTTTKEVEVTSGTNEINLEL